MCNTDVRNVKKFGFQIVNSKYYLVIWARQKKWPWPSSLGNYKGENDLLTHQNKLQGYPLKDLWLQKPRKKHAWIGPRKAKTNL